MPAYRDTTMLMPIAILIASAASGCQLHGSGCRLLRHERRVAHSEPRCDCHSNHAARHHGSLHRPHNGHRTSPRTWQQTPAPSPAPRRDGANGRLPSISSDTLLQPVPNQVRLQLHGQVHSGRRGSDQEVMLLEPVAEPLELQKKYVPGESESPNFIERAGQQLRKLFRTDNWSTSEFSSTWRPSFGPFGHRSIEPSSFHADAIPLPQRPARVASSRRRCGTCSKCLRQANPVSLEAPLALAEVSPVSGWEARLPRQASPSMLEATEMRVPRPKTQIELWPYHQLSE